ncbi:hypothetical protein GCM10010306_079720 [Streptomyces umbrinus]|nr:hypothetical protein GCM10010306_079720 [Streptomyces umbrinus]
MHRMDFATLRTWRRPMFKQQRRWQADVARSNPLATNESAAPERSRWHPTGAGSQTGQIPPISDGTDHPPVTYRIQTIAP